MVMGWPPRDKRAKGEAKENEPSGQGEGPQDQHPSKPDQPDIPEIIISEGDESDSTTEGTQGSSTPRSEPAQSRKQLLEDQSPRPSPPKERATKGEEKSMPQWEAALPTGAKEDLLLKRYKTYSVDNNWVQWVRCSLLGLETGTMPSREDINTSECFVPRAAASELEPPEVITHH